MLDDEEYSSDTSDDDYVPTGTYLMPAMLTLESLF